MLRGHIKVATTNATISTVVFVWNMLQISYCTCPPRQYLRYSPCDITKILACGLHLCCVTWIVYELVQ